MGNKHNKETNEYVHECQLPPKKEVLSYYVPDNQRLQQCIRRACLITSDVSQRKICVKSHCALEQDRATHLASYHYIIHPFSTFRYYCELFMLFILLLKLCTTPYLLIIEEEYMPYVMLYTLFLQICSIVDLVLKFISGFFQSATKEIILNPKKIAIHYLTGYFIFDLIGSIPISWAAYMLNSEQITYRALALLKIFHICTFIEYMERYREKRQYSLCRWRLGQYILILFIGVMWTTYLLGLAIYYDQKMEFNTKLWWHYTNNAFCLVFSLGQMDFSLFGCELVVHLIALVFGFIMRNIIIVQIILMFKPAFSSHRKYMQLVHELEEFAHFRRLPAELKQRIRNYYDFIFQYMYYNENEIWTLMSDKLKIEIERNLYKVWFEADIFNLCPPLVVQSLMLHLKKQVFLVDDVVHRHGEAATHIFFIKCGTVALYTANGREVAHLLEGEFFSDLALLTDESTHELDAVAIEPCELYKLHRLDFAEVMRHFPAVNEQIQEILLKRKDYLHSSPKSRLNLGEYFNVR